MDTSVCGNTNIEASGIRIPELSSASIEVRCFSPDLASGENIEGSRCPVLDGQYEVAAPGCQLNMCWIANKFTNHRELFMADE